MRMLVLSLILAAVLVVTTNSTVIYVPNDQPTVQTGVDAAAINDTVQVAPGTYYEHVTIDKAITLLGETLNTTVIDASDSGDCIRITAARVVVKNLSVQRGGPDWGLGDPWPAGIRIFEADSCLIENCSFAYNGAAGLALSASSDNVIRGCVFRGNQAGIYFYETTYGPYVNNSRNLIMGNWIIQNNYAGILFEHTVVLFHSENLIVGNRIDSNIYGLRMTMSDQNVVSHNSFANNSGWGIFLEMCMGGGDSNYFHHNIFRDNNSGGIQAADEGGGVNSWYDTVSQEGNYWSDYTGSDGDGDGIGDTPYTSEFELLVDLYPLMAYADSDGDGAPDAVDNCPDLYNPSQADGDYDLIGNDCDDCTDWDGDGYGNPGMAANTCPDDNCSSIYNPDQEDFDGDGIGDSCDYTAPAIDEIWTACLGLMVDNDGNFGDQGNDDDGGCNMDYTQTGGECDPNADVYLYDGSPFVLRINGDDTLLSQTIHSTHSYRRVGWGQPYEGVSPVGLDYNIYRSGTFVAHDYSIGMEQWFYVPIASDSCNFIIKALRVYSFDGEQHDNVSIGTVIDWDIPDDGVGNEGGYDSTHRLIYQRGIEVDGQGCQSNDARFGGEALLSFYMNDTCATSLGSQPYSAYVAANSDHLWPARGLAPATLDSMIHIPGYAINYDTTDLHSVMTYLVDQTLLPGDILTIYSVLTTVRDGSLPVLLNSVTMAQRWFNNHIAPDCLCCEGLRGNINHDPLVGTDISDLVYLVDYMFTGGPPPPCPEEADISGDGALDIADLVHLVDYMFTGGPPPVACP